MRCTNRIFAALAAVAVLGYSAIASADPWHAVAPSNLELQVYYFTTSVAGGTGPLAITGNADVTVALDGNGDGTFALNSSQFYLANISNVPLDFGALGTAQLDLTNVGLSISSDGIPVIGNVWDLDTNPPTTLDLGLNDGTVFVHSATGIIAGFLTGPPPGTLTFDLQADPQTVGIADLIGNGIGGTATDATINFSIPLVSVELEAQFGIFAVLTGEINLVPVPEPSSMIMAGLGIVGLAVAGRRRFRRA